MAISVSFSSFSKKVNSTKQVIGAGVSYNVVLKERCSAITPVFIISPAVNLSTYNYAYCASFGRYYFISDVVYYRDRVEVHCNCDVLATYKSQILAGSHYVLRSASDYDENIVDNLYPTTGKVTIQSGNGTPVFNQNDICSIIGILNNETGWKFGAATLYRLTSGNQGNLLKYLMGETVSGESCFTGVESILTGLVSDETKQGFAKALAQPAQYITESYLLPYAPQIAVSGQRLKAGYFTLPSSVQGDIVDKSASLFSIGNVTLNLPDHPQAATRGAYLNLEPFSRYWLYLGPFGIYPLDSSLCYNDRSITCAVYGDINGNIVCRVMIAGHQVDVLHANVKCSFPVGQTTMNVGQMASAATSVGVSATRMALGDPTAIVSGISGIVSAAEATLPKLMSKGNQGTFVNTFDAFTAYAANYEVVDAMNTEQGRPLCEEKTLSTLSGYCLCANAEVIAPATEEELKKINTYLNSGFYIE